MAFESKIHLRMSLEPAYHVPMESTYYSGDLQPAAEKFRKSAIGVLEVGILSARGLGGNKSPYCVAKYGSKWFRTQTVIDSLAPRFHQQCFWEVHEHCTVLTVAVFHNCQIGEKGGLASGDPVKDVLLGKVRIRLSTLETGRIHTHAYPLISLHAGGIKKMGELHLAVRFCSSNAGNMYHAYARPMLPKMHYVQSFAIPQLDALPPASAASTCSPPYPHSSTPAACGTLASAIITERPSSISGEDEAGEHKAPPQRRRPSSTCRQAKPRATAVDD